MATPTFLPRDTWKQAQADAFQDKADTAIWSLGFAQRAQSAISGLASLIQPPAFTPQEMPESDPLPIVVSERPDAFAIRQQQQERQQPASGTPAAMPSANPPAASGTPAAMPSANPRGRPLADGSTVGDVTITQGDDEPMGEIIEGDPEGYFRTAGAYARQVERETGVPAALSLAISANETGYGQRRYMAGANNYHGIQDSTGTGTPYVDWRPGPNGEKIEYEARQAGFASPLEGFRGFARFLLGNPRYRPALDRYRETQDVNQLAADIHAAGYAEDPEYTNKIQSIIKGIPVSTGVGSVVDSRGVGLTQGPQPTTPVQAEQTADAQVQADRYDVAFGFNQPYGAAQFNPAIPNHRGVDLQVRGAERGGYGERVGAFRGGKVVSVTSDPNGGNGVIVQNEDGLYDRYFHFANTSVNVGEQIAPGQQVGVLGESGTEGFPHVHYEVSRNPNGDPQDQLIDPTPYMRGGRVSLNAASGDAPTSGAAAPQAPGAASSSAPGAPPASPWANEPAAGGPLLMKENDETAPYDPRQYDEGPREAAPPTLYPAQQEDGGPMVQGAPMSQPTITNGGQPTPMGALPVAQPSDADQGPREALPGSAGAQPLSGGIDWMSGVRNAGSAAWTRVIKPALEALDAANEWVINNPITGAISLPGAGRQLAGWEQIAAELKPEYDRLADLIRRYDAGDDSLMTEIIEAEAALNAKLAAMPGESVRERALAAGVRNPDKTAETMGGIAQGAAALAIAPGLGSGVVRNAVAGVIDPVGQAVGGGLEAGIRGVAAIPGAARAVGARAGEAAQGVGRYVAGELMDMAPTPRMAEGGSGVGRAMADGPNPSQSLAQSGPNAKPAWQMTPDEWTAEVARVSPDGGMPDPQVDNAAYRRWAELDANKPVEMTPTLQPGPFETDSRLRPAIESSYLRADDFRFVRDITVSPRSAMEAENTYRARAGLQAGGTPRAKFERDGRMTFQGEVLTDPRVGRTLTHEVGHSIENNLPEALIERWQAEIHPPGNDAFAYGRYLQNGGEAPPTPYAGQNWSEDFAESFTEWRQAQAEGRAPNLGPQRQQFMQDVDSWLSGGRSLERPEQPRLLSTVGASPGGVGRDIWGRAATDIGNSVGGGVAGATTGAALPADSDEERRANALRGAGIGMVAGPVAGRAMRRAGGALGTPGIGPNGRPSRPTVETLQQELDYMRSTIQKARQSGDTDLERRAIDRAYEIESALVDARNARIDLEPRISSDVGRRIETLPLDERTADDLATRRAGERVSAADAAALTGPSAVATDMRGRMNSALPFDPASAALGAGGAAGAMSTDEDADPLETAQNMAVAGILGSFAPRAAARWRNATTRAAAQAAAARAAGMAPPATAGDWLRSVGYSGMIGPSTGIVNAVGNGMELLYAVPKEIARSVARGAPREAWQEARGMATGFMRAGGEILDALAGAHPGGGVETARLSQRVTNPFAQMAANLIEAPTRIFSEVPDAFYRSVATSMGESRMAAQIATGEGLKGAAWSKRVNDLLADVAANRAGGAASPQTVDIIKDGVQLAERLTLRGDIGPRGKDFKKGIDALPFGLGNVVMPFFNTPYQMMQRQLERSPIGTRMGTQPTKFDKGYDVIVGSSIGLGVAGLAMGGLVTGSGPEDPEKKAMLRSQGWQSNSTLVGGAWIPNNAFGVFGPMLDTAGEIGDGLRYQKKDDSALGEKLVKRSLAVVQNQVYLRGLSDLITAMKDPGSRGAAYAAQLGSRLIPAGATARTIGNATDPMERQTERSADVGFGEATRQRVARGLPGQGLPFIGGREGLPEAQDVLGRTQENERRGWAALGPKTRTPKPDPTIQAFTDAGVDIGYPPDSITIDGLPLELTPGEQRRWQRERGAVLERFASGMTQKSWWEKPAAREAAMKDILQQANQSAGLKVQQFIGAESLRTRLRAAAQKKAS